MIMQDNEKKPALRFKGFTDPWEQRKLKELYFQLTERNTDLLPYQKTLSVATMSFKTDGNGAADTSLANYKRLRTGDIAFEGHTSKEFRYGRFVLNDVGDGIMSPRFSALRPLHEMPINFWKYYIHYEPIMRKVLVNSTKAGTMMNELVINDFLQGSILVPSMAEQQAIGRFFKQLDTLITLHQRKYEKLVNIKKSMLDKMFPQNGASVPEIRFKGFTDPWEQRKLGDAFERVVRKNTNNESRLPLTISAQDGLVDQITYFNNRVASRDVSNYYLVYNGEFAYNKSTSDGYPFGAVKRLDWYEKGVLSTLYIVFALKHPEKDDSDFMTVFYDTDRWHRGVAERAAEGARNHGLLNISADDFFDIDTTMPEDKVEQEKIGRLLKKLDTLITLHQRKLEKLQNIKKSCLEKMFV